MTTKSLLVLHGKQAANEEVRHAVMDWREQGHDLAVRVTWEAGDAERYVREALDLGYTTLIAGGGDGSVRDIVHAMMASDRDDLSLAILPLGTANDFATAAGIPDAIAEALALLESPATPLSLIHISEPTRPY